MRTSPLMPNSTAWRPTIADAVGRDGGEHRVVLVELQAQLKALAQDTVVAHHVLEGLTEGR